jgi:hypothetical protein
MAGMRGMSFGQPKPELSLSWSGASLQGSQALRTLPPDEDAGGVLAGAENKTAQDEDRRETPASFAADETTSPIYRHPLPLPPEKDTKIKTEDREGKEGEGGGRKGNKLKLCGVGIALDPKLMSSCKVAKFIIFIVHICI